MLGLRRADEDELRTRIDLTMLGTSERLLVEEARDLLRDGREELGRLHALRHERRHALEGGPLLGQTLELPLGLAALGHVAGHPVHEPVLDHGRQRPLEHPR